VFLDTSGLVAYLDASALSHADAETFFHAASSRLIHSYVVAEFVAVCQARKINREVALSFLTDLLENPEVEVIWVDELLTRAALEFLKSRLDKGYSLCDAVSFLIMQERTLTEALTTDHHFDQAGFRRLLA
jgi:predicted nucleic acid-binding protein